MERFNSSTVAFARQQQAELQRKPAQTTDNDLVVRVYFSLGTAIVEPTSLQKLSPSHRLQGIKQLQNCNTRELELALPSQGFW